MNDLRDTFCNCLYYSVGALSRQLAKLAEDAFAPTGLAPSYGFVIMTVGKADGVSPGQIAQTMQLTPSTVTRLVEKLEYKGFLRRESQGRSTQVYLTEAGQQLLPQVRTSWKQLYDGYVALLGPELSKSLNGLVFEATQRLENPPRETESSESKTQ